MWPEGVRGHLIRAPQPVSTQGTAHCQSVRGSRGKKQSFFLQGIWSKPSSKWRGRWARGPSKPLGVPRVPKVL